LTLFRAGKNCGANITGKSRKTKRLTLLRLDKKLRRKSHTSTVRIVAPWQKVAAQISYLNGSHCCAVAGSR